MDDLDPAADWMGTSFYPLGFWISEPYDDGLGIYEFAPDWGEANDNRIGLINEKPR
jgi:hypothetical protein